VNKSWAAPGKLIIIGEYAVLYGSEALVTSVDRYCRVIIVPSYTDESIFNAVNISDSEFRFRVNDNFDLEFITPVHSALSFAQYAIMQVYESLRDSDLKFNPCVITADTSDFYHQKTGDKLGLGSSAAFSVSVLNAMLDFNGRSISPDALFKMSQAVHFAAQEKKGSGIDIAASVYGGMLKYKMADAPTGVFKVNKNKKIKMIYIWTGEPSSTTNMLTTLNEFQQSNPRTFAEVINKLTELAEQGCQTYTSDSKSFLNIIKEYYLQMKILGETAGIPIISKSHCEIAQEVMNFGAVYKPSGAGGGDLGIAFCSSVESYSELRNRLINKNIDIIDISFEEKGVRLTDK
jgi:mevalonate kinase